MPHLPEPNPESESERRKHTRSASILPLSDPRAELPSPSGASPGGKPGPAPAPAGPRPPTASEASRAVIQTATTLRAIADLLVARGHVSRDGLAAALKKARSGIAGG